MVPIILRSTELHNRGPRKQLHEQRNAFTCRNGIGRDTQGTRRIAGSIGMVKRYHAPLKVAYIKIREQVDRGTTDSDCLRMELFSVNSTTGTEGICTMILLIGEIPRPARGTHSPMQLERAKAIDLARDAADKEITRKRVSFAPGQHSGSK